LRFANLPLWEFVMKFLSKKEVRALVLYCPAHIARLEAVAKFPKRVQLGPGRVGWVEQEVLDWMRARIAERDKHTAPK
jgi:prophage regulatory protein